MGVGAPVTQDVFVQRSMEKQQNNDIEVSLELLEYDLQMNFSPIEKLSSFTKVRTKVRNIKNHKFCLKWPEHL